MEGSIPPSAETDCYENYSNIFGCFFLSLTSLQSMVFCIFIVLLKENNLDTIKLIV
jgi:hypothetical protein